MALDNVENFVEVSVSGTYTSSDTTIQLGSGEASDLPDPVNGEYNLVWFDSTNYVKPGNDPEVEIVRVTGRDTGNDTITVSRGRENTSAVAHDTSSVNYIMLLSNTAKMIEDIDQANFSINSVTVAGNNVALGSSTAVNHSDLSNIGSGDHHTKTSSLDEISDSDIRRIITDTSANLPAAGTAERLFFEVDTGRTLYDNGSSWVEVGLSESEIDHDVLNNFVANEHIDHSTVSVVAGSHLTGGGDLTASRILDVDESSIDAGNLSGGSGTSGQVLQTDGSNADWVDFQSGGGSDVSDDGTLVLSAPSDINFATDLDVTDDGDGTVTINGSDTDTTYSAGTGLNLSSTTFNLDESYSPVWTGSHTWRADATTHLFEPSDVATDGGTKDSPLVKLRGKYDSDGTTSVTSSNQDASIQHIVSSTNPNSRLAFGVAGAEKISVDETGTLEFNGAIQIGSNQTGNIEDVVIGKNASASPSSGGSGYDTALGYEAVADGSYSTSLGTQSQASQLNSTAVGRQSTATGGTSTSVGAFNDVSGLKATALGNDNTASNSISIALGYQASTSNDYEMRVAGGGSGQDLFIENSAGNYVKVFDRVTGEVRNTEEKISFTTGMTQWADGLSNEEIERLVLQSGESLVVDRIEVRQKGGGTSSNFSARVQDITAASTVGSQTLGGTTKNLGSTGTGSTALVEISNSTGGTVNASIKVIGRIEGA